MPLWGCYTCALLCKGYHCPHLAKKQGEGPEYSDTAHITTLFPPPLPQNKANPLLIWNYCKMRDSNWFSICRSQPQKERRKIHQHCISVTEYLFTWQNEAKQEICKHISGLRKARMGEREKRKERKGKVFISKEETTWKQKASHSRVAGFFEIIISEQGLRDEMMK